MPTEALRAVRGFLMDLDGTVYMGEQLIGGARGFFDVLRAQGFHSAIGGIALPNAASVRLHERLGFTACGMPMPIPARAS